MERGRWVSLGARWVPLLCLANDERPFFQFGFYFLLSVLFLRFRSGSYTCFVHRTHQHTHTLFFSTSLLLFSFRSLFHRLSGFRKLTEYS